MLIKKTKKVIKQFKEGKNPRKLIIKENFEKLKREFKIKTLPNIFLIKKIGDNLKMYINPKLGQGKHLYFDGIAEEGIIKVIDSLLNKKDIFFDIGAKWGFHTLKFSKNLVNGGKIISFEPNPHTYKILVRNIKLNNIKNCITENVAVSNKTGVSNLVISGNLHDGKHFLSDNKNLNEKTIEVNTISLDEYCKKNSIWPDLIKIDVEGAEYLILEGSKEILSKKNIIVMETHPNKIKKLGCNIKSVYNKLKNEGYIIFGINPHKKELYKIKNKDYEKRNFILAISTELYENQKIKSVINEL